MSRVALFCKFISRGNDLAMRNPERKAKVTPETLEESRKLRALWDAAEDRPSQAVFAEIFEIGSQTAVATFLKGTTPLSKKAAKGFAAGLNCKIEDFSPRLAAEIAEMTAFTSSNETPINELQQVVTRLTTSGKMQLTEVEAMVAMLKAREGNTQK